MTSPFPGLLSTREQIHATSFAVATESLTKAEVQTLAADCCKKLDVHAPLVELLLTVADEGLEMRFPEATLRTLAEFET